MLRPRKIASSAARHARAAIILSAAATILVVSASLAQQPVPKAEPKPAPKAQPKTVPKSEPKAQPKEAPAPAAQAPAGDQPQIAFSAWTKVCQKGPEADARRVCLTGKDGRVESGMPVVAAVLIEPEGQAKKILRVTLPLGMAIQPGTRVIVDQGQPMTGPYVICIPNGCVADYEASEELIGKLKRGQNLNVQGINGSGQAVSLALPLSDFAKAYDGPATDPKQLGQPPAPQSIKPK